MVKPTVTLLTICFVVALCLALVNSITKETIANRAEMDAEKQRKQVMTQAESFDEIEGWEGMEESGLIREAYAAYTDNELIGYVFSASPKGYGGEMKVTIGIDKEEKVTGVQVGDHTETPGLGSKTAGEAFIGQYTGMDIEEEIKIVKSSPRNENEIEAVSGATISSKAVTSAVQASAGLGSKLLQEQDGGVK